VTRQEPFADMLVALALVVQRRYAQICADHDLTPAQGQLLCTLKDGPQRMTVLAASLGMAKNSLSQLVDRTERRGLVCRRSPDRDRRVITLSLTPTGGRIAELFHADVDERLPDIAGDLTAGDRQALHHVAAAIVTRYRTALSGIAGNCNDSC
jgi:DNA-binding MarR family transcriptional regulator